MACNYNVHSSVSLRKILPPCFGFVDNMAFKKYIFALRKNTFGRNVVVLMHWLS